MAAYKLAYAEKTLKAIAAKLDLAETYMEDHAYARALELVREAKELAEAE